MIKWIKEKFNVGNGNLDLTGLFNTKPLTKCEDGWFVEMTPEVEQAIQTLIDYVYEEEHEDFISQDKPPDHIFLAIQVADNWAAQATPESSVE